MPIARLLRRPEVEQVTGLSRATIYRRMADKTFPQAVRISPQTVGWREKDISDWIDSLQPATSEAA